MRTAIYHPEVFDWAAAFATWRSERAQATDVDDLRASDDDARWLLEWAARIIRPEVEAPLGVDA